MTIGSYCCAVPAAATGPSRSSTSERTTIPPTKSMPTSRERVTQPHVLISRRQECSPILLRAGHVADVHSSTSHFCCLLMVSE
ncbi:hypothetical protein ACFYNZ_20235 [Streptomyces kebangsaanensis]|uniref:Uncharacterized protein n=1 Tax=Streptomyces kebangsaanensis TaxID=864058 RepID=A0ABW6KV81_9ACTN